MKTINVDGEIFVREADLKEQYVLKAVADDVLKTATKTEFRVISSSFTLMDEANVLGIGSYQLGSNYICVRISTEYLEKVIKCLKMMSLQKEGLENIDLAWAKDFPAIIGRRNDKGEMSGFVIAPRIETGTD
jgi:hypothetical protein